MLSERISIGRAGGRGCEDSVRKRSGRIREVGGAGWCPSWWRSTAISTSCSSACGPTRSILRTHRKRGSRVANTDAILARRHLRWSPGKSCSCTPHAKLAVLDQLRADLDTGVEIAGSATETEFVKLDTDLEPFRQGASVFFHLGQDLASWMMTLVGLSSEIERHVIDGTPELEAAMKTTFDLVRSILVALVALEVLVGADGLGLTAHEVLVSATSGAADLLGLGDAGVIAPGRRADLLAVDGDPLIDLADLQRTRFVMIAGREVLHRETAEPSRKGS